MQRLHLDRKLSLSLCGDNDFVGSLIHEGSEFIQTGSLASKGALQLENHAVEGFPLLFE